MDARGILEGAAIVAAGAGLAIAVVAAVRPDAGGAGRTSDGHAILRFAAWGAKEETRELRERVVGPVNEAAEEYRVRLEPVPSDYPVKLATMVAGGHAPDIFYLDLSQLAHYAALGALLDLTELVRADAEPVCDLADYYGPVLANYWWGGRLRGLPWIAQPVVLYCNVELFERAGVDLPDRSWGWDRFVAAAKRITQRASADGVARWGFVVDSGWPPLEMYAWQAGGEILGRDGTVGLGDDRAIGAAQFLQDLIVRHRVAPPVDVVLERGISNLFRDGRVAMFAGGAADDLDRIEGLRVAVRELPKGPTGIRATFAWNAGLHISSSTRHPRLAFKAWKKLLEAIQGWKIAPPRRSLADRLGRIEPRKAASASTIRRAMEYMRPIRVIRERAEWDSLLYRRFKQPLVRGERSASRLAREVVPMLERIAAGGAQ